MQVDVVPESTVVAQGEEEAEHFYIVNDGTYQVEVTKTTSSDVVKVAQLSSGASFGDMALLYSTTRTATVRCLEAGSVFRIGRAAYILAVRDAPEAAGGAEEGTPACRRWHDLVQCFHSI